MDYQFLVTTYNIFYLYSHFLKNIQVIHEDVYSYK